MWSYCSSAPQTAYYGCYARCKVVTAINSEHVHSSAINLVLYFAFNLPLISVIIKCLAFSLGAYYFRYESYHMC